LVLTSFTLCDQNFLSFLRSLSFIPWVLIPSEATFRALCTVPPLPGYEKSLYLCCAICLT
ncbi:unnamed protein product, partial [Callosobruchus maculatus]